MQIVDWRCRHDGPALRAERHHTSWVLSVVLRGACRIHQGSWSATLDPATAVLHSPGSAYRTSHPYGCIDAGWSAALDEALGAEIIERERLRPPAGGRPGVVVQGAQAWVGQLVTLRQHGRTPDPLAIEERIIEAFASMVLAVAGRSSNATDRAHHALVDDARAWLNAHFREEVSLSEVARSVGASPAHLCRVFRDRTGIAMRRYLLWLRLAHVIDGMEDTDSLSTLASDAGFYSHSHLTSRFRRELGMAPRELRGLIARRAN